MIKAVTNYQQFINNDTSFFCVLLGMAALMSSFVTLQVKNSGVLNTMDPQEKKVQEVGSLFLTFLKHFLSTGLMGFFSPWVNRQEKHGKRRIFLALFLVGMGFVDDDNFKYGENLGVGTVLVMVSFFPNI